MIVDAERPSVQLMQRRSRIAFVLGYGFLFFVLLGTVGMMGFYPPALGPALVLMLALMGLAFVRPAFVLGGTIVLAVAGDAASIPWWPMTKNLSSPESILFVNNALTIKPIDILLGVLIGAILVNRFLSTEKRRLQFGPIWKPMVVFIAAMAVGLLWGLVRGGDLRIAYFEITPLLYIPTGYFAATNLFTSLAHYRRLMLGVVAALTFEAVHALANLEEIKLKVGEDQSAFEHSAATHFNLVILLYLGLGWLGAKRRWPRPLFLIAVIPIAQLLVDGERRAGIVALLIGGVVLAIVLSVRDHKRFLRTIPVYAVVIAVYSLAFWGSSSQFGFPAQAVKSVIQPDAASESDSLSDLYRDLENLNMNATIRQNPVLGVGFGQPFIKPYPLPDIGAFFEFADYIPHNNILWIWAKTGLAGFISFMYLCGLAISTGLRSATRLRSSVDAAVITVFVSFVPMALVVAYVDISIDPTTMTLLGLSLAAATSAERLENVERGDGGGGRAEGEEPDVGDRPEVRGATERAAGNTGAALVG